MKAKITILGILMLAFAFGTSAKASGRDLAQVSGREPAATDGIRVVSYNIRLGVAKDGKNKWKKRRIASVEMFRTIHPQVLGVQEAYDFQLAYLKEMLPEYGCVGVGREDGVSKGEHMSIFYNKAEIEMIQWGTYWLSETPEVPSFGWDAACMRTATWALLEHKASGKRFFYVNTHLDHVGHVARREGLNLLVSRIAAMNPEGWPMVLTGDFNVEPSNPCLVDLDNMMKSARTYATVSDSRGSWNDWGEADEPIDYIYYSKFSSCPLFRVITESFAGIPYISDHYPVMADLKF